MITTTRIEDTSLNLLRKLSKDHRRSMTQELSVLIEAAVMEFKIFGHDEVIASRGKADQTIGMPADPNIEVFTSGHDHYLTNDKGGISHYTDLPDQKPQTPRDNTEPPKVRRAEAPAAKPNNFNTLQKKSAK